jgi:hypothetical protein
MYESDRFESGVRRIRDYLVKLRDYVARRLRFDDRPGIAPAGLQEHSPLPDSRWLAAHGNPQAFRAMLEPSLDDPHGVRRSKWCPVRLEVAALEAGAADLLLRRDHPRPSD